MTHPPADPQFRPHPLLPGLLQAVVQQMPGGVVVADAASSRVVYANRRAEAILRLPLALPLDLAEYPPCRGFHADGSEYRRSEWPLARALREERAVEAAEIEIERGDGSRGTVRVSAAPVRDASGRVAAAFSTFHVVTEQRRHDAGRRFLAEASKVLASTLDYATTLRNIARLAVPALADWCTVDIVEEGRIRRLAVEHVEPEKAALAAELARRYPPDREARTGVARVLRSGRSDLLPEVDDEVLRGLAQDEEHLRILRELGLRSAMIVPLIARGEVVGDISLIAAESGRRYGPEDLALAEDLALRAALAIDHARLYDESQAANRAKSDFLAVMSHELRTPLTAIIGYTELLQLGVPEPVTPRQLEQLERVSVAAQHLLQLIEEILSISSLEAGTLRVRHEPVRLSELLDRAEIIVRPTALERDLELRIEPPSDDVALESDPDKILQVLLNVLTNAVKFTEHGSVTLTSRRAGDVVEIEVRDTGIGLSAADQARIFEPFWQAERPITRRVGGTGLGLTFTRHLGELLGGEIHVESEAGVGSTFTVRLPIG
jgi:signal transduction histidine kinase